MPTVQPIAEAEVMACLPRFCYITPEQLSERAAELIRLNGHIYEAQASKRSNPVDDLLSEIGL